MPPSRPASDSLRAPALVLRLLTTLPADVEPRRALRTLLSNLRQELGLAGVALEIPDRRDPTRHLELVADGEPIPPEDARGGEAALVTWLLEAGGATIARLVIMDPAGQLVGLDTASLRALVALHAQNGLRGLDLEQRGLFVRCAEHIVARLASGAPEAEVYGMIAESLTDILSIDEAAVFTVSEDRQSLIPRAHSDRRDARHGGGAGEETHDFGVIPAPAGMLDSDRAIVLEDLRSAALPAAWHRLAATRRIRSALAFPLADGNGAWGLVLIGRETPGPVLSPRDTELARLLLQHLAPVLQNSRMLHQLQRSVASLRTLLDAGRDISAVLDLWEIPRRIGLKGIELTGADECLVVLRNADDRRTLRPTFALSRSEEMLLARTDVMGEGFVGEVAATCRTACANRATPALIASIGFEGPGSLLAVPLVSADELLGVLVLFRVGPREFSDLDQVVVTVFGTQAAISLENARLFQSVATERTRLATMIEQLGEGVIVCDADGIVRQVNPAARRWLDVTSDPMSRSLFDLLRELRRPELAQALLGLGRAGARDLTREFTFAGRVDLVSATVIQGSDGPFAGFVLLIRDVTALKAMEGRLMQAGKMAAVGQLASGVAHEFNNLIAAIYGYAQLMRDSDDVKLRRKGIGIIIESSERARRLTQNLLAFSRPRVERPEAVDLNALVESTLQLVEVQWKGEGIEVGRSLETLPETWIEPGSFQEALLNLLTNARHAIQERTDRGAGRIHMSTRVQGREIEIGVVDDGVGIPAADLPRLYDPFFTTKGPLGGRSTPGTGLGLFQVYNLVTGLGGRVEVTSEPGRGAAFRIRLPIRAERPASRVA